MKAKCENCKWFYVSYYGLGDGGKMVDDMLCMYNPPVAGVGLPSTSEESICSKHEFKVEE